MTLAFQAPMENLWNYNPFKTFPIWPRNLQPRTVSYTWALLSRELRIKLLPLLIEWPFPNIWKLRLNHILMSPLLLRHMNPVLNVSHYLLSWQEKNRTMCRHSDCQKLRHKIGDCNSPWPTAVFFSESGDIRLHFDYTRRQFFFYIAVLLVFCVRCFKHFATIGSACPAPPAAAALWNTIHSYGRFHIGFQKYILRIPSTGSSRAAVFQKLCHPAHTSWLLIPLFRKLDCQIWHVKSIYFLLDMTDSYDSGISGPNGKSVKL